MQDPTALTPQQVKQVFATSHIRTDSEQRNLLAHQARNESRCQRLKVGNMFLDTERQGVVHKGEFIPAADLIAAYRAVRPERSSR